MRICHAIIEQGSHLPPRFDVRGCTESEEYAKRLLDFRKKVLTNIPYATHFKPETTLKTLDRKEGWRTRVTEKSSFTFFDAKVESTMSAEMTFLNQYDLADQLAHLRRNNDLIFSEAPGSFSILGLERLTLSDLQAIEVRNPRHEARLLGRHHTVLGTMANELREYAREFGTGFVVREQQEFNTSADKSELSKLLYSHQPLIEVKQALLNNDYEHLLDE